MSCFAYHNANSRQEDYLTPLACREYQNNANACAGKEVGRLLAKEGKRRNQILMRAGANQLEGSQPRQFPTPSRACSS
jgi:hypothetical protein